MKKMIIMSMREEDGGIFNGMDHTEFIKEQERGGMMPDIYFCFILKSLIDDFGEYLVKATDGKVNKEQFEANLITNLIDMIPDKTRTYE